MKIIEFISGNKVDLSLNRVVEKDVKNNIMPSQRYDILLHDTKIIVGRCDARIGYSEDLYYGGHTGFYVKEEYRGNGYAVEAVELLKIVFKENKMKWIYITNNPDNTSSIRVCQKLGAKFIKVVDLPEGNAMRVNDEEYYKNIWKLKIK